MTDSSDSLGSDRPWYRQFWPWFLIAIPALSMVSGSIMIAVALKGADQMVDDDYYRQGLAINENLALDRYAREHGLAATVRFDLETGEVFIEDLQGAYDWPESLQIKLLHPMAAEWDQTLILQRFTGGYRADLEALPRHRYYLRLSPAAEAEVGSQWRLAGEIDFSRQSSEALRAR